MNINFKEPYNIEVTPEILEFLKSHNVSSLNNRELDTLISINYTFVQQIIKELGYNIEVTEVSEANKIGASIKGRDWHRLNKYRWSIVYWEPRYGVMISLTHSDPGHDLYDSEDDAYRGAIDYIINNYQKLEA